MITGLQEFRVRVLGFLLELLVGSVVGVCLMMPVFVFLVADDALIQWLCPQGVAPKQLGKVSCPSPRYHSFRLLLLSALLVSYVVMTFTMGPVIGYLWIRGKKWLEMMINQEPHTVREGTYVGLFIGISASSLTFLFVLPQ